MPYPLPSDPAPTEPEAEVTGGPAGPSTGAAGGSPPEEQPEPAAEVRRAAVPGFMASAPPMPLLPKVAVVPILGPPTGIVTVVSAAATPTPTGPVPAVAATGPVPVEASEAPDVPAATAGIAETGADADAPAPLSRRELQRQRRGRHRRGSPAATQGGGGLATAATPLTGGVEVGPVTAPVTDPGTGTGATQAGPSGRWHLRARWVVAGAVLVAALIGVRIGKERLGDPLPTAGISASVPAQLTIGGQAPRPLWPLKKGVEAAVAIPAVGYRSQSRAEKAVPVASLTKLVTAFIILRDHPLGLTASGPNLTMTAQDVAFWDAAADSDQSNVRVEAGEVLSERQVMQGLLVHSANNLADTLAVWDAGSLSAFVAKMNATAKVLGMDQSHFVDPSGFDAGSVSTPADLLKVATFDMANATFAALVDEPTITLPVEGTVSSYTPYLGVDDVVGVKSGFTDAGGGCDVLALQHTVDGRTFVVLSAVAGVRGGNVLDVAGLSVYLTARSMVGGVQVATIVPQGSLVGTASVSHATAAVQTTRAVRILTWPGEVVHESLVAADPVRAGDAAGSPAGVVHVVAGDQRVVSPAVLVSRLPVPNMWQRLL